MWFSFFDFSGTLLTLKANADNSRSVGSPCVSHLNQLSFIHRQQIPRSFVLYTDSITTYLLMTWDHFCSVPCAVAVKGSRVPITILCIQSDINCRKTALQRFAEAISKWANMPATQLAPLLALTSLSANYSLSFGNKPEHLILLLWKMDHSPFPVFCGWMVSFECSFIVQTILF